MSASLTGLQSGFDYSYVNSVIKNRELYLERLEPSWIAEMAIHFGSALERVIAGGPDLLKAAREYASFASYSQGFGYGVAAAQRPTGVTLAGPMSVGFFVGREYAEGHAAGQRVFRSRQKGQKTVLWSDPWTQLKVLDHEAKELAEQKKGPERHPIYWIGWAHGARNKDKVSSLATIYAGR